jgi:ABC-type antimicrobial peptide transport system permease subunit
MQNAAPDLPYAEVQTFEELLAPQLRPWKMGATLFGVFGVLALLIAAVGLYSAISYGVARRRHEFGVRMALGAQMNDVVRLVMRQGMWVVVIGVGIGTAVALLAGRLVAGLLFDTSPRNPAVLVTVALVSFVVAAAALFIPARRASRADPAAALRGE